MGLYINGVYYAAWILEELARIQQIRRLQAA